MPLTDDEVKAIPCLSVNDVIKELIRIDKSGMFEGFIDDAGFHLTTLAQRISEQQLTRY